MARAAAASSTLLLPRDLDGDGKPDAQILNHPGAYGRVNPFNPCLPHPKSETCKQYVIIGGSVGKWAPFNPVCRTVSRSPFAASQD